MDLPPMLFLPHCLRVSIEQAGRVIMETENQTYLSIASLHVSKTILSLIRVVT